MTRTMTRDEMIEHDTKTAALHKQHDQILERIAHTENEAHRRAGDRQRYVGRTQVWGMSLADCLNRVPEVDARRDGFFQELAKVQAQLSELNDIYRRSPWIRFFPSVTKSQPHIHASLSCRTLHATTVMTWQPQLSGLTYAEAVAELDEALCSVCFPDAPVALHDYVSKSRTAERAKRQADKDARDAIKAAKTLTAAETFDDYWGSEVTTVNACKQLIRDAIEAHHEALWYATPAAVKRQGDAERISEMRANRVSRAGKMARIAETAARVLMARESEHAGWGATAEDIRKIRENAAKKAAKDWKI